MPTTLATYSADVLALLHDVNQDWVAGGVAATLNGWIARAVKHRDLWAGGNRSYQQNVVLTQSQSMYTMTALFPGVTTEILDVATVWLLDGSTRRELNNPPFSTLTTFLRPTTNFQSRPAAWARYGATQFAIAPAPAASTYLLDADLITVSVALDANNPDPMPFPYDEPVRYYTCYLAELNEGRFDKADTWLGFFQKAIRDIEGSRIGEMLTAYGGQRKS